MAAKMAFYYKNIRKVFLRRANSRDSHANANFTDSCVTDIIPVTSQ